MRYFTKISFGVVVISFAGIVGLSRLAYAEDCQDKFNSLTDEQREMFNIAIAEWKPATATLPARAFIVGSQGGPGKYDNNGNLTDKNGNLINDTNPWSEKKIPTSWIMMAPKDCNGRGVVIIHPTGHVLPLTNFSVAISALMNAGFTIATMKHPLPGETGFPLDALLKPPFHIHDLRNSYLGTGHLLRNLMSEVFVAPAGFYAFSLSLGTFGGTGLLAADVDSPFDGYVLGTGGDGRLTQLMTFIEAFETGAGDRIPLTGLPFLKPTDAGKIDRVTESLRTIDPEYVDFINAQPTEALKLIEALAYNDIFAQRPAEVQRNWADMELGAELLKPTIVFHGIRDRRIPPGGAITYVERINAAGASDLLRLYFVKDMAHAPIEDPPAVPQSLCADAVLKLDAWVQSGTEPGPLNASQFGPQPSCSSPDRPFPLDPLGCFCAVLGTGVGGFCSLDPTTVCMTNNPTTPPPTPPLPANEDTCAPVLKGTCLPVIPDECGS